MVIVEGNPQIFTYRKQHKTVKLWPHRTDKTCPGGLVSLAPVLYHGTASYILETWRGNGGIGGERFCLTALPYYAGLKACYGVTSRLARGKGLFLGRGADEFLVLFDQAKKLGCCNIFIEMMLEKKVRQSVVFFDRDALLDFAQEDNRLVLREDEQSGLQLEWQQFVPVEEQRIPLSNALIGALEIDSQAGLVRFVLFNRELWAANFCQAVIVADQQLEPCSYCLERNLWALSEYVGRAVMKTFMVQSEEHEILV